MIPNYINTILDNAKTIFSSYWARKRLLKLPLMRNPFFIVVMSGGLHLAYLALRFIPEGYNTVVIINGASSRECSWARSKIAATSYIEIPFSLRHSEVLDLLFDTIPGNFGVIDYDCYVFREQLFSEMTNISDDCAVNAIFSRHNSALGMDVPETFFLFFNTELINKLRSAYSVGSSASKWDDLPDKVQHALASIGINPECLPEAHKSYLDTLRVIMMLSRVEGRTYRFVEHLPASPTPSKVAFHVGGVSNPANVKGIWDYRGSYFWYRVLELIDDDELHRLYTRKFPKTTASELLKIQTEDGAEISKTFQDFCEHLIVSGLTRP